MTVHKPNEQIEPQRVQRYLRARGWTDAVVTRLSPLGHDVQEGLKDYGYGRPVRVCFTAGDADHDVVLRTMGPDPFGHDRRADRVAALTLAFDSFALVPHHIAAYDVGVFDDEGELRSMAEGEPFLLTEYVEGNLYAGDLTDMVWRDRATTLDLDRAESLACYLATLHDRRPGRDPTAYVRSLRDTVGSSEGIFGLCDSYPDAHPVVTRSRLIAIEQQAVRWRWKLRDRVDRLRRTHGDFHPFNILFREGTDFSVLDCSRGAVGDPADDVAALSINYLFFALAGRGEFVGGLRDAWSTFWRTYLYATGDRELLDVIAPFFAWRGLVVASPVWYPNVHDEVREQLLAFVEHLLCGAHFYPEEVEGLLE